MQTWPAGPHGLLVTNRLGRPVRRSSFGECWRAAVADCGLPTGTRFHDLRHFYASALIASGMHPKAIQTRLGHATISETMDTYGHLFPDSEDLGRGVFDSMLGPNSCAPKPISISAGQSGWSGRDRPSWSEASAPHTV